MSARHLEALGRLLDALADESCTGVRWRICSQLGAAGTVMFTVDVNPQQLSVGERDAILTFAARLANWDHE